MPNLVKKTKKNIETIQEENNFKVIETNKYLKNKTILQGRFYLFQMFGGYFLCFFECISTFRI